MRITGRRGISCHQAMCAVAIGPGSVSIVENPWAGPYRVLRVDPGTLRKIGLIATPRSVLGTVFFGGFGFVGLDGNTIWYVGDGAVRVDARTSRIIARIHLLDYSSIFAHQSASVAGGGSVWITVAAPR
jgi:hypothetical protein